MTHTIHNEQLTVAINTTGAALSSIKTNKDGNEFLWQGDPAIWASQAPVLFPIVGGLKDGIYTYRGVTYHMPKHGFIRYNKNLKATRISNTKVTFSLSSNDETRNIYPFDFDFEISYEVQGTQIIVAHTIKNTSRETMFFSIGGHPAFNCPMNPSETYNDYYIELKHTKNKECYLLNSEGLISNNTINVLEGSKIQLHSSIFDNDALIFKNIQAQQAILMHKKKGAVISVAFHDFPDLGIWAKPNATFVCIEPWLGYTDLANTTQDITQKEGIQELVSNQIHYSSYTITIH